MVQRMSLQICKSCFVGRRLILPHQTYFNFQFSKPRFRLRKALIYKNNKGHGSLALLERQCFWNHFQGTSFKMDLIDSIIWPTILYGFEVWGYSLLEFDWDKMESVYILMLYHIIKTKRTMWNVYILMLTSVYILMLYHIIKIKMNLAPLERNLSVELCWGSCVSDDLFNPKNTM